MKNLFNGKKKWICLLIICLLLVGFVVIGYNSLNKKVTTSSTTNGDNKEANSQTEENKENGAVAQEENKDNDTISNEGSKNDTTVNTNTNNSTKPNSGSSSKPSNGGSTSNSGSTSNGGTTSNSGSGSTSKPENKPTTPSKPENKPSNGGTSKPSHTHNWVAQTKQVHHKEQGHYENVLVKPAWTEEVPVYEERARDICNTCNADITGTNIAAHVKKHMMAGEDKGGHRTEWRKVQVGTKTVKHDAVYSKKWVVDKKAWTETVVIGHKCSGCGQTK
ncbi:hypothetical protein [uncultured Clostridium sp.]|uniref:hypothetical protein n=1 Tax=uncultured Clostridium sp. TaxID=59620 RepID=UPI00258B26C9|nr:hypothetical protein [uncultured Clostridium sp.]